MIKLYSTDNNVLIRILKSELSRANIETIIKNEFPPAAGEITPIVAPPELWLLNDAQKESALKIIAEYFQKNDEVNSH